MVLAPREVILFFGQWLLKEGFPLGDARDVRFHLGSPVHWAGGEAQVEMMVSTVQEVHWTIADAIIEKGTKARESGHPQGRVKTNWTPGAAYNIKEWMWGLDKDASEVEGRHGKVSNHGTEWRNAHS